MYHMNLHTNNRLSKILLSFLKVIATRDATAVHLAQFHRYVITLQIVFTKK